MRSERAKTAAAAAALFAINALVTPWLFTLSYSRWMGSIEAVFIGLARYIVAHFPDLAWFPLWYGGIPYQDSYPPLLHFLVAGVSAAGRIAPALAYHAVVATIYCLGPAALFWAAWRLGASRGAAFAAAILYSFVSPACWLVKEIRFDTGGWFGPRRLVSLLPYGEGPHLASLLFLPLAIGLVHVAITGRRPVHYLAAAFAIAATVLCNWIGAFALAVALGSYLLSGHAPDLPRWLRIAAIAVWAYALAMPWIPPSTIATIRANAPLVGGKFISNTALEATFAATFLLLAWGLKRIKVPPHVRFGLLFLYSTAFIALNAYWFQFILIPQPHRYHLEMDLAFWLAAALIATRIPRTAVAIVLVACVPIAIHQRHRARDLERPADITTTAEYRISRWLGDHLPGRRVFAPGTVGFWMNAFSDTPMLVGGFDNGERNTLLQHVIFQVYFGDKLNVGLDWLKAFGVDAIVGGAPASDEFYHPYAHPDKLHALPVLWHEGAEVIYAVPRRNPSLAHPVRAADLPAVTPPPYDTEALARYLSAIEDPAAAPADFRWLGTGRAAIDTTLVPDQLLSVQVTFDQGWNARVNGEPRRAWGDKLGQIVVEPRCDGRCRVELTYDGGAEMRFARIVSPLALAGGAVWILLWRRRRSDSTKTN